MNIDRIKRQTPISVVKSPSTKKASASSVSPSSAPVLDQISHDNLIDRLMNMPESRSEIVDLGRKLAEDPEYPSGEVLDKLAEMMVEGKLFSEDDI